MPLSLRAIALPFAFTLLPACATDSRDIHATGAPRATRPIPLRTETEVLCGLVGPESDVPGIYGTDLGFSVRDPEHPGRLAVLFGDTWMEKSADCHYPLLGSDDLEASLSERPPVFRSSARAQACHALSVRRKEATDATSWSPIRLYDSPNPRPEDSPLPTGALSTPVATFSDGAHVFALYFRGKEATCDRTSDCPERKVCSSSAEHRGEKLGVCAKRSSDSDAPGPLCRSVVDCPPGLACQPTTRGVCVSRTAFVAHGVSGDVAPTWYATDPRLATARVVDVAVRISPEHSDYAVVDRFVTNRFVNVSARMVAHFDPDHPEKNDYRSGNHTLLLFGRSSFLGSHGAQALPFLAYQVLDDAGRREPRAFRLRPRFYAGSAKDGTPRWSASEEDAVPVYGTETALLADGHTRVWTEPEFDYVNQMSLSFVPALGRWLMLYGGDVPAFMVRDPHTGHAPEPTHQQPIAGAIYLRTARHPWGAGPEDAEGAWSSPSPLLTREMAAPYLACGSDGRSDPRGCLSDAPRPFHDDPGASGGLACAAGDLARAAQSQLSGNPVGRFYAPNVIDEWTDPGASSGSSATIYWNVSTWNPYQVILVRSVLRSR